MIPLKLCVISSKQCWQHEGKWYSTGGFPTQMEAISSIFLRKSFVIVNSTPKEGGQPLPEFETIVGLKKPNGKDSIRKLSVFSRLIGYCRQISAEIKKCDVVHIPLPGDISLIGFLLSVWYRKKIIARYGGAWEDNNQTTWASKLTKRLMRLFASPNRQMLVTGYFQSLPKHMHGFFSTTLSESEVRQVEPRCSTMQSPPNFIYIGRLSSEKGVNYLIRAMADLLTQLDEENRPQLFIAGDGPMREQLESMCQSLNISQQVTFLGHLNKEDLRTILPKMDLCIQPSLTEGFSKAWVEALLYGIPVISSRVGAASYVIEDHKRGWLVSPEASDEIVEKINYALTITVLNWQVIQKNCHEFASSLTIERWKEQIENICRANWAIQDEEVAC